ncbi:DUF1289 domain-containing protein [Ramlibacter sp.]|uniref:DUF1289 domain-containing protein n=1 Tax=Ramlibacter sp. TaxID=1917967 RepID=UPI00184F7091|nr:DUF1289 domain-containing protein [Ramlibacter sp.]MBA2673275.1 DUF1289 domain-containing protein [Ramlibacter sp.]
MKSVLKLLTVRARQALEATDGMPSPCQSVCRMEPDTGLCEGCLRTLDEITAWSRMDDAGKREVWHEITLRLATRH